MIRLLKSSFLFVFAAVLLFNGCKDDEPTPGVTQERVVVANRASGDISFIDAETEEVVHTLAITGSEPMYVVYVAATDKIYVGDRAQNKVHVVNPQTYAIESAITVGNGVFHMWADGQGDYLWVNNDVDNTISVVNLSNNTVAHTIDLGIKPHDVFLTEDGSKAYVSVFTSDMMEPDSVYLFDTQNYEKLAAKAVGKDPHLFHLSNSNKLFVPCQSGDVFTLEGNTLNEITHGDFEGAHGIFATTNQDRVIVTNISGAALYVLDGATGSALGPSLPTGIMTPHNVVINQAGTRVFITHSGPSANQVTSYALSSTTFETGETLTVGTNPFGLAYYQRDEK